MCSTLCSDVILFFLVYLNINNKFRSIWGSVAFFSISYLSIVKFIVADYLWIAEKVLKKPASLVMFIVPQCDVFRVLFLCQKDFEKL